MAKLDKIDKTLLEEYGIDNTRYIPGLGLDKSRSGSNRFKPFIRIYVKRIDLEAYQAFAIWCKLEGFGSIRDWLLDQIDDKINNLMSEENNQFKMGIELMKEHKRNVLNKLINEENKD